MKVKLTSIDPYGPITPIVLEHFPVVIGRNPNADVRLDSQWVSRVHCEISEREGTLIVRDLDSRNGTLVNGRYIQEAPLMPGDRLTIGMNTFEVWYERSPKKSMSGIAVGQGRQ